jgi:hypothetical protein
VAVTLCCAGAGALAALAAVVWSVLAANAAQARRREQSSDGLGRPCEVSRGDR